MLMAYVVASHQGTTEMYWLPLVQNQLFQSFTKECYFSDAERALNVIGLAELLLSLTMSLSLFVPC